MQHGAILRAPGFCAGESGSYTCRKKAVSETPPAALGGANQCRTETCLSVTDTCLGDDSERCFCAQNACVACRDPQCSEHVLGVRGPSVDGGSHVSVPPRASEGGAAVSPASTPGPAPPSSSESPSSLPPGAPSGGRERLPTAHRRKPKSSHMCVSWAWTPLPGCLCPAALAWTFLAILLAKAPSRPGPFRVPPAAHTWPLCPSAPGPPPQPVSCLQGLGTATQRGCPAASLLALSLPFGTCQALFEFLSAEQPPLRGSHLPAHSQTVQRPLHLPCCAFAKGKSGWFCSSRLGHCYQGLMGIGARV